MFNLRSLDLNLLTVFEAIYELGTVSGAADRLALSQSATSHALSRRRDALCGRRRIIILGLCLVILRFCPVRWPGQLSRKLGLSVAKGFIDLPLRKPFSPSEGSAFEMRVPEGSAFEMRVV